jgi:membrane protease YdiL (CAAX protease family)
MFKEIIKEVFSQANIVDLVICTAGLLVLAIWLLRTGLCTKALINAPVRRNDMLPHLAFIPFLLWFLTVWLLTLIKQESFPDILDWQDAFIENLVLCLSAVPVFVTSFIIARYHFARGIKGLGFNPKTIFADFGSALLNMLATMPAVLATMVLTIIAGKLIAGPDFQMPRHEELKQIIAYSQWQVRAIIVFTAILVVPVTEEMLFRGMLQTLLRSYTGRPWLAVILASLIFALFHANPPHWPALFVFSLCLGYSYEKSGSLFRAIFLHMIFNAISVFSALGQ